MNGGEHVVPYALTITIKAKQNDAVGLLFDSQKCKHLRASTGSQFLQLSLVEDLRSDILMILLGPQPGQTVVAVVPSQSTFSAI